MNKKKIFLIIAIALVLVSITIYLIWNNKFKDNVPDDALRFKEEYESLNNTIRESDGANYNNVEISSDNPIKYISASSAVDIIKNKTGIIYFGTNWCPWCRNAIEVLFEVSERNDIDTIYYVNMDDVKNAWEVQNGKLVKTQIEKDGYYELLSSLDSILGSDTYALTDSDGKRYDTGEKRIYMPLVIAVKNGSIVKNHVGTVKLDEGQTKYDKLSDKQRKELENIYDEFMKIVKNNNSCLASETCN